jgi:hypothetical protein
MAQYVLSAHELKGSGPSLTLRHSNDVNISSRETLREEGSHVSETDVEKGTRAPQREPSPTGEKKERSDLVEFDGPEDVGNPKNWSRRKRWAVTVAMGLMTFVVTFASSIFSVAIDAVSEEYHVSPVVATLGVSLFLLVSQSKTTMLCKLAKLSRDSSLVPLPSVPPQRYLAVEYLSFLATYSSQSSRSRLQSPRISKRLC